MKSKKKPNEINNYWYIYLFFGLVTGLLLGMMIQQTIIQSTLITIAHKFNGKVEINLNTTQMALDTKNVVVPAMTNILNNTVINEFSNCNKVKLDSGLYLLNCSEVKR
jgi:hypothetical protein